MTTLSRLLKSLLPLILTSCAHYQISDYPLTIQLPASKQCYTFRVVSHTESLETPAACEEKKIRAILLTSEAWKMIKTDALVNCTTAECTNIKGAGDSLFLAIDKALDEVPDLD